MKKDNGLSLQSSFIRKSVLSITKMITHPRASLSWVLRGHLAKDQVFVDQTYWFTGKLPRIPLARVLLGIERVDVSLPRALDRKGGTSISLEEACHVAAIIKHTHARKALEIGTYDGNTALLLASNLPSDGTVVTVDLPPDFDRQQQGSLAYTDVELNLTDRNDLGRQYRGHPLASRIQQHYGDSAALDWNSLGGPFDLIFIDGCHSEEYVASDSRNAMKQLTREGVILWHDYGMIPEVSKVVDRIAEEVSDITVFALEGTRLAMALPKGQ
jgi:predicted O-methyltransferase YrrM